MKKPVQHLASILAIAASSQAVAAVTCHKTTGHYPKLQLLTVSELPNEFSQVNTTKAIDQVALLQTSAISLPKLLLGANESYSARSAYLNSIKLSSPSEEGTYALKWISGLEFPDCEMTRMGCMQKKTDDQLKDLPHTKIAQPGIVKTSFKATFELPADEEQTNKSIAMSCQYDTF